MTFLRSELQIFFRGKVSILLLVLFLGWLFLPGTLFAQEGTTEGGGGILTDTPPSDRTDSAESEKDGSNEETAEDGFPDRLERDLFLNAFLNRIKVRTGLTYAKVNPFVLKESSNSWLINSIWGALQTKNYPFSAPVSYPDAIPMWGERLALSYSYRNRLHIEINHGQISTNLNRSDPTSVIFFNPANELYTNSLYEGVRLLGYRQTETRLQAEYVHPVFSWFRAGGYLAYEKHKEENNFSFGSYTLTKATSTPPYQRTWSIGGDVQQNFHMNGMAPGIVGRFYPWEWFEVIARMEYINRKGNFDLQGWQLLQRTFDTGDLADQYSGLLSFYSGDVKEKGYRTRVEAVFQFCRFSVHTGMIYEKMNRRYDSYLGASHAPIADFSAKTSGNIGFAEMSNQYPSSKTEFFIEPAVSMHF